MAHFATLDSHCRQRRNPVEYDATKVIMAKSTTPGSESYSARYRPISLGLARGSHVAPCHAFGTSFACLSALGVLTINDKDKNTCMHVPSLERRGPSITVVTMMTIS
jgi:hypothetical protein